MPFADPIKMIEIVAEGLGDLSDRFVFIGGAATSLYYQDNAAAKVRPTYDVDCVVEIARRSEYFRLEDELRSLGFKDIMQEEFRILASDNRSIESMIPILGGTATSADRSMMILNFMRDF
jgi:hypothetical protein